MEARQLISILTLNRAFLIKTGEIDPVARKVSSWLCTSDFIGDRVFLIGDNYPL